MRVRAYPPIETVTLAWYCDGCGLVIPNGGGWIEISYLDLCNAQERERRVRANVRSKAAAGSPITPADLSNLPKPVRWMAWHQDCLPLPQSRVSAYRVPIARVRNLARLIELHGLLADTPWQSLTNFRDLRLVLGIVADTTIDTDTDTIVLPSGLVSVRS